VKIAAMIWKGRSMNVKSAGSYCAIPVLKNMKKNARILILMKKMKIKEREKDATNKQRCRTISSIKAVDL
jgi:hypothetical protein